VPVSFHYELIQTRIGFTKISSVRLVWTKPELVALLGIYHFTLLKYSDFRIRWERPGPDGCLERFLGLAFDKHHAWVESRKEKNNKGGKR
jgi:hypothetical protein